MSNFPVPFRGTKEQREANFRTHSWGAFYDDCPVCMNCDAKVWHQAANYPCGTEPERVACEYEEWVELLRNAVVEAPIKGVLAE